MSSGAEMVRLGVGPGRGGLQACSNGQAAHGANNCIALGRSAIADICSVVTFLEVFSAGFLQKQDSSQSSTLSQEVARFIAPAAWPGPGPIGMAPAFAPQQEAAQGQSTPLSKPVCLTLRCGARRSRMALIAKRHAVRRARQLTPQTAHPGDAIYYPYPSTASAARRGRA